MTVLSHRTVAGYQYRSWHQPGGKHWWGHAVYGHDRMKKPGIRGGTSIFMLLRQTTDS